MISHVLYLSDEIESAGIVVFPAFVARAVYERVCVSKGARVISPWINPETSTPSETVPRSLSSDDKSLIKTETFCCIAVLFEIR